MLSKEMRSSVSSPKFVDQVKPLLLPAAAGGLASPRPTFGRKVEVLAPLVLVHATSPRRRTSLPTFTDRAIVVAASVYVDVRTSSFDATTHISHIHRRTRS